LGDQVAFDLIDPAGLFNGPIDGGDELIELKLGLEDQGQRTLILQPQKSCPVLV
jgi:hypothetical protein